MYLLSSSAQIPEFVPSSCCRCLEKNWRSLQPKIKLGKPGSSGLILNQSSQVWNKPAQEIVHRQRFSHLICIYSIFKDIFICIFKIKYIYIDYNIVSYYIYPSCYFKIKDLVHMSGFKLMRFNGIKKPKSTIIY